MQNHFLYIYIYSLIYIFPVLSFLYVFHVMHNFSELSTTEFNRLTLKYVQTVYLKKNSMGKKEGIAAQSELVACSSLLIIVLPLLQYCGEG